MWFIFLIIIMVIFIAAPMILGNRPMVVLSGSMEPTYHTGSVLYYKSTNFEAIKKGDVITFKTIDENSFVTHRVFEKNEDNKSFVTKGDANPTPDSGVVSYDRVTGKALDYTLPYAGYFINYVKDLKVIAFFAFLIIVNWFISYATDDNKRPRGRRKRVDKKDE